MRSSLLCIATWICFAGAGDAFASEPEPEDVWALLPGSPESGVQHFEAYRCSACHTIGTSVTRVGSAPNLGRMDLRVNLFDGVSRLWNHAPGMMQRMAEIKVTLPPLTGRDLLELVSFFTVYQYYLTNVGRPGLPDVGEALFKSKDCGLCHKEDRQITNAPSLDKLGSTRSVLGLAQAMWNHGPQMQTMIEAQMMPRPFFREHEMADVLSYIVSRSRISGSGAGYIVPGSPAEGRTVFVEHGCNQCHAVHGVGGKTHIAAGETAAPDLGVSKAAFVRDYTDIAALLWNHAVPMWGRMRREGIAMVPFKDNELANLVAYLFFLNFVEGQGDSAKGKEVFERRGCSFCHVAKPGTAAPEKSTPRAVPVRPWDVMAAMWNKAPEMRLLAQQKGRDWPRIEDGEMRDLVAYVKELNEQGVFRVPMSPESRAE